MHWAHLVWGWRQATRLLELGDAQERLARLEVLRSELQGALEVEDPDLADNVMASLQPGLAAVGDFVDDSVQDSIVTEDLGLELRLSAMVDGELSGEERVAVAAHLAANPADVDLMTDFADLGRQLRQSLSKKLKHDEVDLWVGVAREIGVEDPEEVPGWDEAAEVLREAIAARAELSAAEEGKLNALPRPQPMPEPVTEETEETSAPAWRRLFLSPALPALAALCIVVLMLGRAFVNEDVELQPDPTPEVAALVEEAPTDSAVAEDVYAMVHETEVESLEMDDDVLVQVIQMEEGAPLFLMIDEGDEGATL